MNVHEIKESTWQFCWIGMLALLTLSLHASASDISGSVINKTRGKPAIGDDVVLISLSQGMLETARTKTDTQGRFELSVPDDGVQHLIRVVHEGVKYHKPAPQGTRSVDVEVYDAAPHVDNVFGEGRVLRLQTTNGQLQVSEMYILRNESTPPRTQMSDRSFEVTVPDGAEVETGEAAGPGGMPVTSAPVPTGQKNHYAFIFPIRPGRTQFQITYHVSYAGNHGFNLNFEMPFAELGVMLPKSMQFKATGDSFQQATDESGMNTYVVKSISAGQQIGFMVSGEGSAPGEAPASVGTATGTPGGGLGAPVSGENSIGATTAWYVLGGLVAALVSGGYFVTRRSAPQQEKTLGSAALGETLSENRVTAKPRVLPSALQASAPPADTIRGLLKEELFQIETEHLQGSISKQQYNELRTGINALMRRHVEKCS